MQVTTVKDDDLELARQTARHAADVLAGGGLVIFPTETVYGLAASAASQRGFEALRALKHSPEDQAYTVHLPDPAAADRYIEMSSPLLRRLIRKVFPGPVTLVVDVPEEVIQRKFRSSGLPPEARPRIYHHNTISLRCPDHPLAQMILGSLDAPVIATSANRPGDAAPYDADEAAQSLGDEVDLIVDGGRSRYAKASTVVRVTGEGGHAKIEVERDGVYDERFIRKLMRWTMLLVCSGNTCRSPMAEAIAKKMLADERGLAVEDLETAGLRILSAGAFAHAGMPPSHEAVEALKKSDVDLAGHRSRLLTPEMVHEADVIYCMTESHRQAVLDLVPSAEDKTFLLDPNGDIDDPIGSGLNAYLRCAEIIRRRLAQRLKEQQP